VCSLSIGSSEATNPSDAVNENFCSAWHNLMTAIAVRDFVRAAPIKQQESRAMLLVLLQSLTRVESCTPQLDCFFNHRSKIAKLGTILAKLGRCFSARATVAAVIAI